MNSDLCTIIEVQGPFAMVPIGIFAENNQVHLFVRICHFEKAFELIPNRLSNSLKKLNMKYVESPQFNACIKEQGHVYSTTYYYLEDMIGAIEFCFTSEHNKMFQEFLQKAFDQIKQTVPSVDPTSLEKIKFVPIEYHPIQINCELDIGESIRVFALVSCERPKAKCFVAAKDLKSCIGVAQIKSAFYCDELTRRIVGNRYHPNPIYKVKVVKIKDAIQLCTDMKVLVATACLQYIQENAILMDKTKNQITVWECIYCGSVEQKHLKCKQATHMFPLEKPVKKMAIIDLCSSEEEEEEEKESRKRSRPGKAPLILPVPQMSPVITQKKKESSDSDDWLNALDWTNDKRWRLKPGQLLEMDMDSFDPASPLYNRYYGSYQQASFISQQGQFALVHSKNSEYRVHQRHLYPARGLASSECGFLRAGQKIEVWMYICGNYKRRGWYRAYIVEIKRDKRSVLVIYEKPFDGLARKRNVPFECTRPLTIKNL